MLLNKMADGLDEMGLAQTDTTIYDKGIEGCSSGSFGNSKRCGMGKLIAVTYDKIVKSVARIQPGGTSGADLLRRGSFLPGGDVGKESTPL